MGWLERLDRRNQRTLEYHNAVAQEPPPRLDPRLTVALVVAWFVVRIAAEVAFDRWSAPIAIAAGAIAVVALGATWLSHRRRRLAWEARQGPR